MWIRDSDVITTIFRHNDSFFSTVRRKGKVGNDVVLNRESGSQKMHRFVAVSYTHLDVYKRQGLFTFAR